jgi:hypothetical protein
MQIRMTALGTHAQFMQNMHTAVSMQYVESLLQEIMDAGDAPSPSDAVRPWPSGTVHAFK